MREVPLGRIISSDNSLGLTKVPRKKKYGIYIFRQPKKSLYVVPALHMLLIFPICMYFCLLLSSSGGGLFLGEPRHLLSGLVEAGQVGALDHGLAVDSNLVPVLEEEEGGHGRDAVLDGDGLDVVDVDLGEGEEARNREGARHLGVMGSDGLARPAPVGVKVGDYVAGRLEELIELAVRRDVLDGVGHFVEAQAKWVEGEKQSALARVARESRNEMVSRGTEENAGRPAQASFLVESMRALDRGLAVGSAVFDY